MYPKITQRNLRGICVNVITSILFLVLISSTSYSQVLFNEGFNTVVPLPAGWAAANNSNPAGTTNWFQGNATVFPSNSGATTAYIGANYNNTGDNGTISNWLFTPTETMKNGDVFTFYTRVPTGGATFPDRLQLRMSTNGASTNVGITETSVGDFSTLLLDINPTYGAAYPEVWTQFTVTISGLGGPTSGRLAFRYFVEDAGLFGNNSNFIGIDDAVYTTFASSCTGAPDPGNTISSVPNVCPTINFTLSLQNNPPVSGLTFQWQKSADGVTNWTDIGGATQSTLVTSQTTATYYRCNVTCSGTTTASNPLQVAMSPASSCYCDAGSPDQTFEKIANVTYNTINNSSTSTLGYENFTSIVTPVIQGSTLPMTVTISNAFNTDQVIVWIDFNHNGDFTDAGEKVLTTPTGVGPLTGNITVPATALLGQTRMRVRMHDSGFGGNTTPCGNSAYGQVEDYTVDIQPCIQGVIGTSPANASMNCGGTASFAVIATGSLLTYSWEQRVSATAPWTNVTDGGVFSGATTATLNLANAPVSMNGYQYRAIVQGPCTAVIFSAVATLTVNPFVPNVSPASATLCTGGSQLFATTAPIATATATTGTIALNIPDNTANGVQSTLNISGIPAGAVITDISVNFNLTHTYVGDMLINLKAPTGNKILALDKYMSATANQAGAYPNIGFVNTTVSSNGTTTFGSVTSQPVTGTFAADGLLAIPFAIQNPAGFASNVTTFGALYTAPTDLNGTWTLAMADGGPADFGVLTSWTITISYLSGPSATATWSPITGLFLDPALTQPYQGTVVGSVYAAPTTTTTYTLQASTPICSGTGTVVVTVNSNVDNVSTVANEAACDGGNASFSVTADGGIIDYQWQESTDAGATWTDLADGGVYSGTHTGTLSLTGVDASFNNYMYQAVLNVASCNTATSNPATLTVNPNAVVVIAAGPYTQLYPGLTTTLTAAVSPNAASSYQWYKNGVAIPGATAATYVVDVDGLGDYYAMVNDVNTCSGTSNTITISDAPNDILFIYPSPNSGQFKVRYQSRAGNVLPRTLTIYDSKGSRVFYKTYDISAPYGSMDVDMGTHSRGIYRVELGDRNGNRIKTGSVLIQ